MMTSTDRMIPLLPLRNTVVFPGMNVPLKVGRAGSIAALKEAQKSEAATLLVTLEEGAAAKGEPAAENLHRIGVLAKIESVTGNDDDGYRVLVRGLERFRIHKIQTLDQMLVAKGEPFADRLDLSPQTAKALLESMKNLSQEILGLLPTDTTQISDLINEMADLSTLSHLIAANLPTPVSERQRLLETESVKNRALLLLEHMQKQRDDLKVQTEIQQKLTSKFGRAQRENILREQKKTIQEELGEGDQTKNDDYLKKIKNAKMPADVEKVATNELHRLETAGNGAPEANVIRNYLDLLCAMPWSESASNEIDLARARTILENDHSGLPDIKKRIIEHLAVMKLKKGGKGSILPLVGPPGVGKTSLGQSIARALGKKFARVSLGGVRDDAEVRGHRRTYIGAMPGRIIQAIKRAGENNPVLMLDEVDKLGRGYQGDPAAALLEVLDPEQNASFVDHYLDVPFDLSKVFFILTANTLDSIPGPLLDRMEVVELNGYTTAEKLHIARNHLMPKQLAEHGLNSSLLELSDPAILRIIHSYTREAGVRELQRQIARICRGSSEKILSANTSLPVQIGVEDLEALLGSERHMHEIAEQMTPPGVVTGLAWTPQGGEILFTEATLMPGGGSLTMTGQLGDVMKESAQIALSLVRSYLPTLAPELNFEKKDLHIHVPAGAIPKDGPSAGITLFTTIASLFTGRSVNPKLAMTGEITLRGTVMPVGGIKEKVLAAHRAGIERIILPKRNQADFKNIPEEIRSQLRFDWVENAGEVLKIALELHLSPSPLLSSPPKTDFSSPSAVA